MWVRTNDPKRALLFLQTEKERERDESPAIESDLDSLSFDICFFFTLGKFLNKKNKKIADARYFKGALILFYCLCVCALQMRRKMTLKLGGKKDKELEEQSRAP